MRKLIASVFFFVAAASGLLLFSKNNKPQSTEKKTEPETATGAMSVLGLINSSSILDAIINDSQQKGDGVELKYFTKEEFSGWFDRMSPELLKKLDEFRHEWGFPVQVSPHHDAVGREHPTSQSQHNIMKWGEVRAVDVFPKNSVGGYINSVTERRRVYEIAKKVGFTGIGLYTDTTPGNMLHVDVRPPPLAKWSRVAGQYKAIEEVLA